MVADTAGKWPVMEDLSADFVYVRLHGSQELYVSGYGPEALDAWAVRVAAWRDGGQPAEARTRRAVAAARRDVFVYFDNDVRSGRPGRDALARRLAVGRALRHLRALPAKSRHALKASAATPVRAKPRRGDCRRRELVC